MPGNFAPMQKPPTGAKREKKLEKSGRRLEVIIQAISSGKKVGPRWDPLSVALLSLTKGGIEKNKGKGDTFYTVDDRCTGCGICRNVCPMKNITFDEKSRPVWNHDCTSCAACLNFCPSQAIQMKVMLGTEGRGRYHHPEVTLKDIAAQKGET
jgi:NAD-dependent dihydropyrimidine dehydrogenase PreA subunit